MDFEEASNSEAWNFGARRCQTTNGLSSSRSPRPDSWLFFDTAVPAPMHDAIAIAASVCLPSKKQNSARRMYKETLLLLHTTYFITSMLSRNYTVYSYSFSQKNGGQLPSN